MGRMVIGLDLVCPYPATLLILRPIVMMIGALIVDIVTCKPRLMGSGLRISRKFLRMMQLINSLGEVFHLWVVQLYLVPLIKKEILDLHMSSIFLFLDKYVFIWMYIFFYYVLYVNNDNAYIDIERIYSQIGSREGRGAYFI